MRELATLYTRWRKRPFNAAIRAEVRSMAAHRYTPRNHRIYQLLGTLNRVSMTVEPQDPFLEWWHTQIQ